MKKQLLMTVLSLIAASPAFAGPKVKQNCPQCQLPSASFSLSVESPCANGKCPAPVSSVSAPITSGPITGPIIPPTGDIITESQTEPGGVYWRLPDGRLSKTNPWGKTPVAPAPAPAPVKARGGLSLNLDITGPLGGQLHFSASVGRLLQLHNAERARVGASPLIEDPTLTAYAQAHSQKQANSGRETCFHSSPLVYAENVAYTSVQGQDADQAHRQWMNSKAGHREQLLNSKYTRVGFAAVTGPKGTYFTEVFQ